VNWPRGLRAIALAVFAVGIPLVAVQRWLVWRALETAAPARRWASLVSWHLGMLRASYYPAAGQRFVPWIQRLYVVGCLGLFVLAIVFVWRALRSTAEPDVRAG